MLSLGLLLRYRRIMFVKRISSLAKFAPDKMGKSTIAQGDFLFAGLNSFEPGQEHAPHAHDGQDKLYLILEGSGMVQVGDRTERLSAGDGLTLYRTPDLLGVGWMANVVRERLHGNKTFFNIRLSKPASADVTSKVGARKDPDEA